MRNTLVQLGLLVLSAAAAEIHVDWSQHGRVVEGAKRRREADPADLHIDWSQGGVIIEGNQKRKAEPDGIHVDWSRDGVIVEEKKDKRANDPSAASSASDPQETDTNIHKHRNHTKSEPTEKGVQGHVHGGGQTGGPESSDGGSPVQSAHLAGAAITVVTDPRSGGAAQTITAQSQRATMFIPTLTYCGQASAEQTETSNTNGTGTSAASSGDDAGSGSDEQPKSLQGRDTQAKATNNHKKKQNKGHKGAAKAGEPQQKKANTTTTSGSGDGSQPGSGAASRCQTLYRSTVTPICHTTLRGNGIEPVTVSDCDQQVTFRQESNEDGTTEYIAHWNQVQWGHVPTGTVTVRQCQAGSCTSSVERWQEASTAVPQTQTVSVAFNEQVVGPATMNYGNQTVTVAAGKTSRVAIHTQLVETQTAQQAYVERVPLSKAATASMPSMVSAAPSSEAAASASAAISAAASDNGMNFLMSSETATPEEITTTITRYSSTTITVTDWPSNTAAASPAASSAAAQSGSFSAMESSNAIATATDAEVGGSTANQGASPSAPAAGASAETSTNPAAVLAASTEPAAPVPTSAAAEPAVAASSQAPPSPSTSPSHTTSSETEPFDSWSRSSHHSSTATAPKIATGDVSEPSAAVETGRTGVIGMAMAGLKNTTGVGSGTGL